MLEKDLNKYFEIFQSIGSNIWIWDTNTNAVLYSDGFWNTLGFDGKNDSFKELSCFENRIHSNELFEFIEELSRCLENAELFKLEVRIKNKNSEYQWCLITGRFIKQEEKFYGNLIDIDSYRKIKEHLNKEHSLSQALIDNIPFGIITLDTKGRVVSVNEYGKQSLNLKRVPESIDDIFDKDDLKNCREYFQGKLPMSVVSSYKLLLQCDVDEEWKFHEWNIGVNKESMFPAHISIKPMMNKWNSTLGFLIIIHDLTSQKRMNLQLAMAQKWESVGQLAAGIAHEINTPSQYIGDNLSFTEESLPDLFSCIDELKSLIPDSEKVEQILGKFDIDYLQTEMKKANKQSIEGVSHISTIVNSMKEFSHPSQNEKCFSDINRLIENAITITNSTHKYVAAVEFIAESPKLGLMLYVDEMNQVLLNLIVNASHAIQESMEKQISERHIEKGTISIKTKTEKNICLLSIADSGYGIEKENLVKIFDPFFTTKEVGKGTGQGLAIVYRIIVEKHGGMISVDSTLGKGTTFLIKIPLGESIPDD